MSLKFYILIIVSWVMVGTEAHARSGALLPTTVESAVDVLCTTALASLPAELPASEGTKVVARGEKSISKARRRRRVSKRRKRSVRRARRGFVRLEARGPGFVIRDPHRSWGTELTVRRLKEVSASYAKRFPSADPIRICDVSRRRGGRFRPHVSHRAGRDVDVGLILKRKRKTWVKATAKMLHVERMWFYVSSLVATGDVQYIFLDRRLQRPMYRFARSKGHSKEELSRVMQYPRRGGAAIIRHWKGHRDHIHVRFVRPPRKANPRPVS